MSNNYVTKEQLEESMKALEKKLKKNNASKISREPNEYNKYMKDNISKIKNENPNISNVDAFKKCAESWNKIKVNKQESIKDLDNKEVKEVKEIKDELKKN